MRLGLKTLRARPRKIWQTRILRTKNHDKGDSDDQSLSRVLYSKLNSKYIKPSRKYKESFEIYTIIMNLIATKAVFDSQSGDDKTCFMHIDLRQAYTDRHVCRDLRFFSDIQHGHGMHRVSSSVQDWKTIRLTYIKQALKYNDFGTQSLGNDWLWR